MKKISIFLAVLTLLVSLNFVGCSKSQNVTTYNLNVTFNDTDYTLSGTLDLTYYNDTNTTVDTLKFNLFPNAYRKDAKFKPVSVAHTAKAYYSGISYGNMQINSVKKGNKELEFSVCGEDENIMSVPLKSEVYPDEKVTVTINFTVELPKVNHRLGVTKNTVNLGNFFPILCVYDKGEGFYECVYYSTGDPFYSQTANFEVTFSCPEKYVVASSGEVKQSKIDGGIKTTKYAINNARDFSIVLSENFECISTKTDSITVNYYYYSDAEPEKSLQTAIDSLNTFNRIFGKYPYRTYSVVETGFLEGGMEFPALVYISDNLERRAYDEVIVHETAHQWWYAGVGNNEIKSGFLDEGLAEYSVVLFYENNPSYGITREELMNSCEMTYQTYCTVYDRLFGKVDTSMLRELKDYSSEYEYVNIAYIKGCLMFDYLRQTVGDKKFFGGLKQYYEEYLYKTATPTDLVGVFERYGADTNGFFDSFFNGKVII